MVNSFLFYANPRLIIDEEKTYGSVGMFSIASFVTLQSATLVSRNDRYGFSIVWPIANHIVKARPKTDPTLAP